MRWLIPFFFALPAMADVTTPSGRTIDCYCTDTQGARVELGESICLQVNGRMFMAKCDMSLNVPIWRDTGDGCVTGQLAPAETRSLRDRLRSTQPRLNPTSINPQI